MLVIDGFRGLSSRKNAECLSLLHRRSACREQVGGRRNIIRVRYRGACFGSGASGYGEVTGEEGTELQDLALVIFHLLFKLLLRNSLNVELFKEFYPCVLSGDSPGDSGGLVMTCIVSITSQKFALDFISACFASK